MYSLFIISILSVKNIGAVDFFSLRFSTYVYLEDLKESQTGQITTITQLVFFVISLLYVFKEQYA